MKLRTDSKFLGTLVLALAVISVLLVLINRLAGPTAANITAVGIAAFAVEIFRKFEELSTQGRDVELSWPSFLSWPVVLGLILMQGVELLNTVWKIPWRLAAGPDLGCSVIAFVGSAVLSWGGYFACGWLVGRLLPLRGQTVAALGIFLYLVGTFTSPTYDLVARKSFEYMTACVGWQDLAANDPGLEGSARVGGAIGLLARGLLAVYGARVGVRNPFPFAPSEE